MNDVIMQSFALIAIHWNKKGCPANMIFEVNFGKKSVYDTVDPSE